MDARTARNDIPPIAAAMAVTSRKTGASPWLGCASDGLARTLVHERIYSGRKAQQTTSGVGRARRRRHTTISFGLRAQLVDGPLRERDVIGCPCIKHLTIAPA